MRRVRYVLRGDAAGESYTPPFTWHGFRYARLTSDDPGVRVLNLTGVPLARCGLEMTYSTVSYA